MVPSELSAPFFSSQVCASEKRPVSRARRALSASVTCFCPSLVRLHGPSYSRRSSCQSWSSSRTMSGRSRRFTMVELVGTRPLAAWPPWPELTSTRPRSFASSARPLSTVSSVAPFESTRTCQSVLLIPMVAAGVRKKSSGRWGPSFPVMLRNTERARDHSELAAKERLDRLAPSPDPAESMVSRLRRCSLSWVSSARTMLKPLNRPVRSSSPTLTLWPTEIAFQRLVPASRTCSLPCALTTSPAGSAPCALVATAQVTTASTNRHERTHTAENTEVRCKGVNPIRLGRVTDPRTILDDVLRGRFCGCQTGSRDSTLNSAACGVPRRRKTPLLSRSRARMDSSRP
jgi:hypothetical protein